MSEKQPKLRFEEEKERTATRSPPKKSKVEQSMPKKQKLKQDADKAAEKSQHLRFGKAEITPDEASRMTKQQKRAMYAAAAARSAAHREIDQNEDDNVGTQALNEGVKSEEAVSDFSKNRYARKLKKKAKLQAKKNTPTAKSSAFGSDKAQSAEATSSEVNSNWFSRWWQKQDIQKSYRAATRSGGTAAQTAGGQKAASGGVPAAKSGMEQVIDKGKSVVSTAVNGIANFAKSNAHVLLIVGVFLLLLLLVMSAFSSCSILFSGTTQVSGQTIYTAEDRDIRGAETDYKKLEKELDKKIKRTPTDNPGYDEYRYHLDDIEHDPWQLTSFLTTLYDDYTRSEVQAKLKETFAKQYKLTTWVEVQTRYRTVVMIDIFTGIPYTVQVPYEYRIFHTKLVNKGLEVVIREELDGGEPVEEAEQPVLTSTTDEEDAVTVTDEENGALTPEGNLTLVDDYHTSYSDGSGQQFITLVSKSGNTFYLVIDRNAKGENTVHFMNLVDEADLLSLMEEEDADAYTAEKEAAAQAEQERKQAEEDAKKAAEEAAASSTEQTGGYKVTKYAATFLGVLALVGLAAGGGIYTFMKQKQKKQAEKEALDPDANYTEDKGDFEIPVEDEPEEAGEEDNVEE